MYISGHLRRLIISGIWGQEGSLKKCYTAKLVIPQQSNIREWQHCTQLQLHQHGHDSSYVSSNDDEYGQLETVNNTRTHSTDMTAV